MRSPAEVFAERRQRREQFPGEVNGALITLYERGKERMVRPAFDSLDIAHQVGRQRIIGGKKAGFFSVPSVRRVERALEALRREKKAKSKVDKNSRLVWAPLVPSEAAKV